jgi:hypothetical protein
MRLLFRVTFAAFVAVAIIQASTISTAVAQTQWKQIKLTEKQVQAYIASFDMIMQLNQKLGIPNEPSE